MACDTGPGNALIDDFMRAHTGMPLDRDGDQAAKGQADETFVAHMLEHPFFAAPSPKSLDRNDFAFANVGLPTFSVEDGAATLALLTAASVARIVPHLPRPPRSWIVAGGGAHNRTLMTMLRSSWRRPGGNGGCGRLVGGCARGAGLRLSGGARAEGAADHVSGTTGAQRPMTGGVVAQP